MKRLAGALALTAALFFAAPGGAEVRAPRATACSVGQLLDGLRAAQRRGSPALRRYLRRLFEEAAPGLPYEELRGAFEAERDPGALEVLGAALAARSARSADPAPLRPIAARLGREADPALRAAAVRAMRGIGSVEALGQIGAPGYEQLIRDPAPAVREAVAENLIHEDAKVYFGHDRGVAAAAVRAAAASPDPELAARILGQVSMEQADHAMVAQLTEELRSQSPALRAAAARALGGVPAAEAPAVRATLTDHYRGDSHPAVRQAVLEALVHLGLGQAAPILESLRPVDPGRGKEIDAWLTVLQLNLQEWYLVLREKQRLAK